MRKIRKLYLQNSTGERFGLNGEAGVYAAEISGLGFTLAPGVADLGYGFFAVTQDENEPQQPVAWTLVFTQNPYIAYQRFIDWLFSAGAIAVVYDPAGVQEYLRDVSISSLQKGELNQVGWLEVPISVSSLSPWYRPAPARLVLDPGGENIKRYSYTYTEDLRYGDDNLSSLSGTISVAGHIPGAVELTYAGAMVNPRITLTGMISGKEYGSCHVAVTLLSSDTLRFSTRYEDAFVKSVAADGTETDLLDVLDLTLTPFFRIPTSEPCLISLSADSDLSGICQVLTYSYFRSV